MGLRRATMSFCAAALCFCLVASGATPAASGADVDDWLTLVNYYRGLANVSPIEEDPSLSDGALKHAQYMLATGSLARSEDPANPLFSPEGDRAAQNGALYADTRVGVSDQRVIEGWMQSAFHSLPILDPRLATMGFGSVRDADAPGGIKMAAVLDLLSGQTLEPTASEGPVMWPGEGAVTPLDIYVDGEYPDGLTSCPGYGYPAGLPIAVSFATDLSISGTSITRGRDEVGHCTLTAQSYVSPDPVEQATGRSILSARRSVVLIPRSPLMAGEAYHVEVATSSGPVSWSFTMALVVCQADRLSICGSNAADDLRGTAGPDVMYGGPKGDRLSGGFGPDKLNGGTGKDTLIGGPGRDILKGGPGEDTCIVDNHRDKAVGCENLRRHF